MNSLNGRGSLDQCATLSALFRTHSLEDWSKYTETLSRHHDQWNRYALDEQFWPTISEGEGREEYAVQEIRHEPLKRAQHVGSRSDRVQSHLVRWSRLAWHEASRNRDPTGIRIRIVDGIERNVPFKYLERFRTGSNGFALLLPNRVQSYYWLRARI